jgi:hypothetical protein
VGTLGALTSMAWVSTASPGIPHRMCNFLYIVDTPRMCKICIWDDLVYGNSLFNLFDLSIKCDFISLDNISVDDSNRSRGYAVYIKNPEKSLNH